MENAELAKKGFHGPEPCGGEYVEDKSCCPCAPMAGQRSSCFRAVCSVSARDSTEGSCAIQPFLPWVMSSGGTAVRGNDDGRAVEP